MSNGKIEKKKFNKNFKDQMHCNKKNNNLV